MIARTLSLIGVLLVIGSGFSAARAQRPLDLPFEMAVPIPPTPFNADGKTHLAYELHLTNFSPRELTLDRVEVLDATGKALAAHEGEELANRLGRPGLAPAGQEKQRIGGGMRAIVYLWVTVDGAPPKILRHRLNATLAPLASALSGNNVTKAVPAEMTGDGPEIVVRNDAPLVIAPPLRGSEWLAANGPGNASGHRRALIPIGGRLHIAQRLAIDWVQLREDGRTWAGDQLKNESYRAYGAEALAVADGIVSAVKDGIPQNIPGVASRAVPITLETIGGNHVILDLGRGRYAFYAHLQPGSVRVTVGAKVRRGQVVGLVGNSGNSTEPHLHFHISNANSPLGSEGLPYAFESFEQQGAGWFWKPAGAAPVRHVKEMPLLNAVVKFPDAR